MEMIRQYLEDIIRSTRAVDLKSVRTVIDWLEDAYRRDKLVCLIGNGGSAANASHFAEDLCKGALKDSTKKRFRVLSLTDNTPFITAIGNDIGYEDIFVFQVRQFMRPGDLLMAISGSGNSPNVIKAVKYAKANRIKTIGFTGFDGGKLKLLADLSVHVPLNDMCKAEAVHSNIFHGVTDLQKERIA